MLSARAMVFIRCCLPYSFLNFTQLVLQGASPHPVGSPVFGERRSGRAQRNPTKNHGSKDSLLLGFAALYPTYNRDLPAG